MSEGKPAATGIAAERELLEPLRRWADVVISTTASPPTTCNARSANSSAIRGGADHGDHHKLRLFARDAPAGRPDLRHALSTNPHWIDDLRPMTGQDAPVGDYIRQDPAFDEAFARIRDLLLLLLPRFEEHGKAYVNIAFGCTGGRHRSVFMAEQIASALRDAGFSPIAAQKSGVTGG
jgi:UPF0042 nucleotide-binding protein